MPINHLAMSNDLFDSVGGLPKQRQVLADGVCLLHGYARDVASTLLEAVHVMALQSPFRQMETPGGYRMSVAMTNCGEVGWASVRLPLNFGALSPGFMRRSWAEPPASVARTAWG